MVDYPVRLPRALLEQPPAALALLRGDDAYPALMGEVLFYSYHVGCLLVIRAAGMPEDGLFPLSLHANDNCSTGGDLAFCAAGPAITALPPLLFCAGRAWAACALETLPAGELSGRSVVLSHWDGRRLACGAVTPFP